MFLRSLLLLALTCCGAAFAHEGSHLRYETIKGDEISKYAPQMARLGSEVYREYPYFYDTTVEDYRKLLVNLENSPNSLIAVALEGNEVVGFITSKPLSEKSNDYQQPFVKNGENPNTIYYIGEVALKHKYIGTGVRKQMYEYIENLAKQQNPDVKKVAIAEIDPSTIKAPQPTHYKPIDIFMNKIGFQRHPELTFVEYWKNTDDSEETPHTLVYWTKSLE